LLKIELKGNSKLFQIDRVINKGEEVYNLVGVEIFDKISYKSYYKDIVSKKWLDYSAGVLKETEEDVLDSILINKTIANS
jgi:hypothetical protein